MNEVEFSRLQNTIKRIVADDFENLAIIKDELHKLTPEFRPQVPEIESALMRLVARGEVNSFELSAKAPPKQVPCTAARLGELWFCLSDRATLADT